MMTTVLNLVMTTLLNLLIVATKLGQQQWRDASVPLIASSWFKKLSVVE